MPGRPIANALLMLALVAGPAACRSAPPADATVRGVVLRGPLCPVEQEGQPCPDAPTAATVRVLDATSRDEVAVAEAGADGQFEVAVPGGAYVLEATADGAMSCAPLDVTVAATGTAEVVVSCDTGIR